MFCDSDVAVAASAILVSKHEKKFTWERINELYHGYGADRRRKVWFGCCTNDGSGIWYLGDPTRNGEQFVVEVHENKAYARMVHGDLYSKKPCWVIELIPDDVQFKYGFVFEWQSDVLI